QLPHDAAARDVEARFADRRPAGLTRARVNDPARFIRDNTALLAPPLVPEVKLHLATEVVPLWRLTETELHEKGGPPPYWAFAWAGGQALARHVLDNPVTVRGKTVLDFGAGSGLVAIAAAKAQGGRGMGG